MSGAPHDFEDGHPVIRSRKNERLRLARALGSARGRRRLGRFLLEGPKAIREVLAAGAPGQVEQVLYRAGARADEALAAARAQGVPCYPVAADLYDALAPSETPQPLLAVAHQRWGELAEVLGEPAGAAAEAVAGGGVPRAVAACFGVQDPGNLGTILRTARFLGLGGVVVLPGTQDPWSPKVVRSAAGTLLAQPPARADGPDELLARAAGAGFTPVALVAHEGAPLPTAPLPARALLLLGAEGQGLPTALEAAPGVVRVTIPSLAAGAESLNVAVAFGIAAYAWCARWRAEVPGG